MRLFDRISTLAKADAHGVVESLEDRALLLKQYVREAEIDLDHKRARAQALEEEGKRLGSEKARIESAIAGLDEDIALALESEQDDLARFAIKKLLPLRRDLEATNARLAQLEAEGAALEGVLVEQQAELEDLKSRVRAYLATGPAAKAEIDPVLGHAPVADEEVELELLHRRQQMGGV